MATWGNQTSSLWRRYRWKELGLLIIPFMILILATIQLFLADQDPASLLSTQSLPTLQALIPVLGLIGLLLSVNLLLSFFFPKADQVLLPLVGLMSGLGVLMATRLGPAVTPADPALGSRQLIWVVIGLVACIGILFGLRKMAWLERFKYTWALLGIVLVGFTLARSFRVNLDSPTHDQLNIGPFSLQPSELLKIFIVVFFAAYLSEYREKFAFGEGNLRLGPFRLPPLAQLGVVALMLGLALALFLGVRELGLALLIYGIFLCMLYLGSGKLSYVIGGLLIFFILGFIAYNIPFFGYVRNRFGVVGIDVLTPSKFQSIGNVPTSTEALYQTSAFQIVQGLIALSSGGILGAGFGLGHPGGVPVVQSDLIFAAIGEEFGLAGLFAIIGLYLLIVYRGYRIAVEARDPFNQLLAAGLSSIFAIQTLIITFGNMKFLPLTGIPLPFLSYGGSSIIANYIIVGILLRISHNTAMQREGLA